MARFLKILLLSVSLINSLCIAGLLVWRGVSQSSSEPRKTASVQLPPRPVVTNGVVLSQNATEIQNLRGASMNLAESIAKRYPNDVIAICLLGKLHLRMGNANGAMQLWNKAIELENSNAEPYIDLAFYNHKLGNHEQASKFFFDALERDSQRAEIYMPLVDSLVELGRTDDAIIWLKRLLDFDLNDAAVWTRLGQVHSLAHDTPQAILAFEEALCLDPFARKAANELLSIYRSSKMESQVTRFAAKIEFIDKTFPRLAPEDERTDPDLAKARDLTIFAFMSSLAVLDTKRDGAGTAVAIEQLLELVPNDPSLRRDLTARYTQSQSSQKVIALLQRQCDLSPQKAEPWLVLGRYAMGIRDLDRADVSLRRFIGLEPNNPVGYSLLSQVQMPKHRDPNAAVESAQKAVELEPRSAHYYLLATAFYHQSNLANAKKCFQKAIELDPFNTEALDALEALENQP